ncbi:MAG: dihydrofolate reductase, partial [Chthoniobacter sp.]|nr:dihydrofolate reductase [Chthoniobacter sp.]
RGDEIPGVEIVRDLAAFEPKQMSQEVWVIGGAEIYAQLLPRCSELYLSVVLREIDGDAFFPRFEHLFDFAEVVEAHAEFEVRRYTLKRR